MGLEGVPARMRAVQVVEYNQPYQLNEIETPRNLGPQDLLVKIAVASNCHTDGMVQAGTFGSSLPLVASHEGAGTVVAVGSSVTAFHAGDRVMCGILLHPCGVCADCQGPETSSQYCAHVESMVGVTTDGCFAEYVRVDSRTTSRLPDAVRFESAAPLACAGRTVWRGVVQTGLRAGEWVAIVGSGGGLGHLGIQFAKALGLQVIGIDARDEGLALSQRYGADVVVDAREGKDAVVKAVQAVTAGAGADSTICLSDHATAAATACAVTKMHGTMVQIAQPETVDVPFAEIIFRDIRIRGSLISSEGESQAMLECIAKHGITVATEPFYGLDKIGELVEKVHGGKLSGKAIVIVDPGQIEAEKKLGAKY